MNAEKTHNTRQSQKINKKILLRNWIDVNLQDYSAFDTRAIAGTLSSAALPLRATARIHIDDVDGRPTRVASISRGSFCAATEKGPSAKPWKKQ